MFTIGDDGELKAPKKNELDFVPLLETFLSAYAPAATIKEADKFFTTQQIISRLEVHLGITQRGDIYGNDNIINGSEVVTEINAMGFKAANVGGCMQWLMKKKKQNESSENNKAD